MENPTPTPEYGVVIPHPHWNKRDLLKVTPLALTSVTRLADQINPDFGVRGHLPDPIDVFNHVGNTAVTFVILSQVMRGYWGNKVQAHTSEEFSRQSKKIAWTIGTLTVLANVFAEKVGYGKTSTPDVYDFIYGLAGGLLAYNIHNATFVTESDIANYKEKNPDSSEFVERFEQLIDIKRGMTRMRESAERKSQLAAKRTAREIKPTKRTNSNTTPNRRNQTKRKR